MNFQSLASALGVERGNIYRWVHEIRTPNSETLVEIVRGLRTMNPQTAAAFVQRFLGDVAQGIDNRDN